MLKMFFNRKKEKTNKVSLALHETVSGEMVVSPSMAERELSTQTSLDLRPGAGHYRAYVGPPRRYDYMGATQFALLFHMGLRDHHRVLDFGCGSLRLGRLLIPFLRESGYFGIDPNGWLIEDGLARELGNDAAKLKAPKFSYNQDFNCNVFDQSFDFVIAQSILTHTGADLFEAFLKSAKASLAPGGVILFTYNGALDNKVPNRENGWHYPECVDYTPPQVNALVESCGLVGRRLPWFHPRSTWHAAALDEEHLPSQTDLEHLSGAVLRDEQFTKSLKPIHTRLNEPTPR